MILSDRDIIIAVKKGDIVIKPYNENDIQPASVDLHLDKHFLVFDTHQNTVIDPKKNVDSLMKKVLITDEMPFILHPGEFALGNVLEVTGVSNSLVGRLEGKSSLGRLGLLIHATAGFLDPGNSLKMTLELHNTADLPILLYYKMPIAQMAFEKLSSPCITGYKEKPKSKYIGDLKPIASQYWKNFEKK